MGGEGFEAIGDMAVGGMAARAVEPGAGEGRHVEGHDLCLNCGTALVGDYCHACGQHGHVHRTLTAWWHDLAHGVLHLDGKVWRTLPLLALKPGNLTRRYIEGERAKFVSPMAIFLFSVFLMFVTFTTLGGPVSPHIDRPDAVEIARQREAAAAALAKIEEEQAAAVAAGRDGSGFDEAASEARSELAAMNIASGVAAGTDGGAFLDGVDLEGKGWLAKALKKARENPSLILYKIQNNAYKFSWALIPISVPFVALLFLFSRRFRMYDHTVFVTYSIAFMTLLMVALSLMRVAGIGTAWTMGALLIVPPLHMYRQLKGAYALGRLGAAWRTAFLLVFSTVAASLFLTLLVFLGLA